MSEIGKRCRQRDGDNDGKNQKRRSGNRESFGDGELVIYRILCPDSVIGSVIGKGGKVINSIRQETHAKIKVVDPFPGSQKRVINIFCFVKDKDQVDADDEITEPLCPSQDALLRVHSAIANALLNTEDADEDVNEEVELLVPTSQASNIIGKSGSIIKKLRAKTKALKMELNYPYNVLENWDINSLWIHVVGELSLALQMDMFLYQESTMPLPQQLHPPAAQNSAEICFPACKLQPFCSPRRQSTAILPIWPSLLM